MRVTLPTLKKEYDSGTDSVKVVRGSIQCTIDTSVYAETRWEQAFPETAKRYKLFDYIDMLQNTKGSVDGRVYVAAMLKAVFCFMEFDELTSYKEFVQMFDLAQEDFCVELIQKIRHLFDLAINGSATKN